MDVIVVEDLHKSYGDVDAVRGISFEVRQGEVLALLGPNGAGKTTTLEILEGFRSRSSGRVEVLGLDPGSRASMPRLRERVGIVLQETATDPYLTVREVLQRNAGYYPAPRDSDEVIALVGLEAKSGARVKTLSGGQQRRLDVALGIIGDPELLFLDEPTTGFDPSARREAWDLVRRLTGGGTTVVLTTHYMDEAQALADRAVVVADGLVVAAGTPNSLGGRDRAAARIRFSLPPGQHELPVPSERTGDQYVVTTDEEVRVLHEITGWSLRAGVPITGLALDRPSLEDVYVQLTTEAAAP